MPLSALHILTLQQLKGVGTMTIYRLAEQAVAPIDSLSELSALIKRQRSKKLQAISEEELLEANSTAKRLIEASKKESISLVGYYDKEFPDMLRYTINEEGKHDPPLLLWYRGNLKIASEPGLAIIGTREATPEGIAGCAYLSAEFAKRGLNIISGLAIGCDTSAHRGVLSVGGKTTAFLANGLNHDAIYPSDNQELAEEIVEKGGLLLSEYPIGQGVNRYNLVARDRLQAGLANATLVVQTGLKGGTMHAARTTFEMGKPLFVMKFKNEATNQHEKCQGNVWLAAQGARYISGGDDLDALAELLREEWIPCPTDLFNR